MYSVCDFSQPVPLADSGMTLPLAGDKVCAGFPSPAEDFAVKRIDLTQELVTHPQATFLLRVSGESMREAGIFDGDMLVVNKALKPRHGQVVVAVVDGECRTNHVSTFKSDHVIAANDQPMLATVRVDCWAGNRIEQLL